MKGFAAQTVSIKRSVRPDYLVVAQGFLPVYTSLLTFPVSTKSVSLTKTHDKGANCLPASHASLLLTQKPLPMSRALSSASTWPGLPRSEQLLLRVGPGASWDLSTFLFHAQAPSRSRTEQLFLSLSSV